MTDRSSDGIELLLRSTPPPTDPPRRYAELARAAALGERPHRREWILRQPRRRLLVLMPIAVIVAATIAFQRWEATPVAAGVVFLMRGGNGSSGRVVVARPNGAVRSIVLTVDHLPPAPPGGYYELWYSNGSRPIADIAFNTPPAGRATLRTSAPATQQWQRCWVTVEPASWNAGSGTMVMRSM